MALRRIGVRDREALFSITATRAAEHASANALPPHTLTARAGEAVARLAQALVPRARCIWIACGPGNNGGDGFEAALHLHRWGKRVSLTWSALGNEEAVSPPVSPPDAQASRLRALGAGVPLLKAPPADFDFCVDALLGMGATLVPGRPQTALMQHWLDLMAASPAPCLAIDAPTGLNADSGMSSQPMASTLATNSIAHCARIHWSKHLFTLSLLTLKPGLFTASGKDCAGEVWFDALGTDAEAAGSPPRAWLLGTDLAYQPPKRRPHTPATKAALAMWR